MGKNIGVSLVEIARKWGGLELGRDRQEEKTKEIKLIQTLFAGL
jgi:hypothetical protein